MQVLNPIWKTWELEAHFRSPSWDTIFRTKHHYTSNFISIMMVNDGSMMIDVDDGYDSGSQSFVQQPPACHGSRCHSPWSFINLATWPVQRRHHRRLLIGVLTPMKQFTTVDFRGKQVSWPNQSDWLLGHSLVNDESCHSSYLVSHCWLLSWVLIKVNNRLRLIQHSCSPWITTVTSQYCPCSVI